MTSTATDFDGFYKAHYGETVAMTYGFTADLSESQDIAQEAFSRAWQRWKVISHYEQPVSWVRRVATHLAHSRWRRLKVASAYVMRQRIEDLPELSPDHVDMVAALRTLPVAQRKAVVLHYLVDLPVAEIAEELGVADGTVKSWLHRGRNALAAELGDEVRRTVSPIPAAELRLSSDKRRGRRTALSVAAAFLAVIVVVTGFQLLGRAGGGQPLPPASPDPSISVDPSPSPTFSFAPAKAAPPAPASCRVERLPLPAGHGPASHLSGGDPTGRYLLGSSNDTSIYIWDNGKLIASRTLEGIDDSQLVDINSAGVAVGYSLDTTGTVPWLYRDNQFVRLPGGSAEPKSINENNVVVGMADSHPVIWRTPESQPEKLAMPAGYSANRVEISEEGLVVASAESFTRPPGPNRSFVWYPDGTFTELERPALSPDHIEWGATRIRGEWASGTAYLNFKYVALRWNLRTGKSEVLPELGGFPSHNEHGWIGAPNPSPVIRTGTGQLIPLPTNISGVVKDSGFEAVHVLSDNGRYAAGELAVGNSRDNDNVAVRWVCT